MRVDDSGTAATHGTVIYGYDATGRLLEECHQVTCDQPTDPFTRWTYDDAGRRVTETTPEGTTTYTHDTDGNLATAAGPEGTTTYTYDPAGRRIAEDGPDGPRVYAWDAAGRLAAVIDGAGVTTFGYDGDGTRIELSGPDGDVALTWDPNGTLAQPVAVAFDDGTTVTDTTLAWASTGVPAWVEVDGALQVSHADQVWNPTAHTDHTGALTHTTTADPWGHDPSVSNVDPGAPDPALGFSATIAAASADGLVHMRARDYDPTTGEFLTPDPWQRP
ncbi:MAG: hypothetical protein GXX79_10520, partial [Actinomycetales bacterium]|nr:hypothetical protein [Actinomycetales bacterium]